MKKPRAKSKAYYRRKCDALLQNIVRLTYTSCIVCGKTNIVGHHYWPKSSAGVLRYNMKNIVPLCMGCHYKLHLGYPSIQNAINEAKGKEWLDELNALKRQFVKCDTISYYKNMVKTLELLMPYRV